MIYSYVQFLTRNPHFVRESTRNLQLQETVLSDIILSIRNLILCTYVHNYIFLSSRIELPV